MAAHCNFTAATIKESLQILLLSKQDEERAVANRFLESFQETVTAWQVCLELLSETKDQLESRIFASQTLRKKVCFDFLQLPSDSIAPLYSRIFAIASQTKEKSVLTQLFLTLIYVFFQQSQASGDSLISTIFAQYQSGKISIDGLLEFLTIFPDECRNSRVPMDLDCREEKIRQLLAENVDRIFQILFSFGSEREGHEDEIFSAILSWFKHAVRSEEETVSILLKYPLIDLGFSGISNSSFAAGCCELLQEIIFKTSTCDSNRSIAKSLYDRLIAAVGIIKESLEVSDEVQILGWINVFTEYAFSYEFVFTEFPKIGEFLAEIVFKFCLVFQSTPHMVEKTFSFWETVLTVLERSDRPLILIDVSKKFLFFLVKSCAWPENLYCAGLRSPAVISSDEDDLGTYRMVARDNFVNFIHCLGVDFGIEIILRYLEEIVDLEQKLFYSQLENFLFFMIAICKEFSLRTFKEQPKIFALLHNSIQRATVAETLTLPIKRHFIGLLGLQGIVLEKDLFFILNSLSNPDLFLDSVKAIGEIAGSVASALGVTQYCAFIDSFRKATKDGPSYAHNEIFATLSLLLSSAPKAFTIAVYLEIVDSLLSSLNPNTLTNVAGAEMCEILSTLVKGTRSQLDINQQILHRIRGIWQSLLAIAERFGSDILVMEAVARLLKYFLFYSADPMLFAKDTFDLMIASFCKFELSWPIYLLRHFLRDIPVEQQQLRIHILPLLKEAIERISSHLFSFVSESDQLKNPDVIVDFFKLAVCVVDTARAQDAGVTSSAQLKATIRLALLFLPFNYGEVGERIVDFLGALSISQNAAVRAALEDSNQDCFLILLQMLFTKFPSSFVYLTGDLIRFLYKSIGTGVADSLLISLLRELPETHFTTVEKERFLKLFQSTVLLKLTDFEECLYSFTRACHRRLR